MAWPSLTFLLSRMLNQGNAGQQGSQGRSQQNSASQGRSTQGMAPEFGIQPPLFNSGLGPGLGLNTAQNIPAEGPVIYPATPQLPNPAEKGVPAMNSGVIGTMPNINHGAVAAMPNMNAGAVGAMPSINPGAEITPFPVGTSAAQIPNINEYHPMEPGDYGTQFFNPSLLPR